MMYGLVNYLVFLGTFLYLAGFVGNLWVPRSMDSAPVGPLWQALLINTLLGVLYALFALGWLIVLITTFLINHFDLFGLRQVWLYFLRKPYTHLGFRTPGPYRFVRHPLYVGWLMAFWATPTMTMAHLVFALGMTAYILIAIPFEERNLAEYHGTQYTDYRRRVPMLIPGLSKRHRKPQEATPPPVATRPETPVSP
jgi:protein-S-isoprenylcysteine O-methyltransferase Ste14